MITVLFDAGHGIDTNGKKWTFKDGTKFEEWEFNRIICDKIKSKLNELGINFDVTYHEFTDRPLSERVNYANTYDSKNTFLISVHSNADIKESVARGFEVWTSPGCTLSDKMASIMYNEADKSGLLNMRSIKEAKFMILTDTNCPAILTENGFYTNYDEVKNILNTPEGRQKIADYHIKAIVRIINECY
jgi:N-acetylmuramoyl-L-alanine amidase